MRIKVGPKVPRRGNMLSRGLGHAALRLLGWRLEGEMPNEPKLVMIGAPHTTNMDGVIALLTLTALGLNAGTMIKESAFKGVLGVILRWFGALSIDRNSAKGVVEQSVDAFNSREQFLLLIAPEGTRSAPAEWKRGFYHVAAGAKVPVLPAACNYKNKKITLGPLFYPTNGFEQDFPELLAFYRDYSAPRHPQGLSKPLCEAQDIPWTPKAKQDD